MLILVLIAVFNNTSFMPELSTPIINGLVIASYPGTAFTVQSESSPLSDSQFVSLINLSLLKATPLGLPFL